MSTILLVVLAVAALLLYGAYKLFRWIAKKIRRSCLERRYRKKQVRIAREAIRFEASIDRTSVVSRHKVFDSNRKHHYETTFMVHFKNHNKKAITTRDGSSQYDMLMSKLEEKIE